MSTRVVEFSSDITQFFAGHCEMSSVTVQVCVFVHVFETHIIQKIFPKYIDPVTSMGWQKKFLATCFCSSVTSVSSNPLL